jgi:hypothetical protein
VQAPRRIGRLSVGSWVLYDLAILRRVDDRPRDWGADDLPLLAEEGSGPARAGA